MSTSCRQARDELLRPHGERRISARRLEVHLGECSACARFAARAEQATRLLEERSSTPIADDGFAHRVMGALPATGEDVFAWAALRALPAALALALLLGAWSWSATGSPTAVIEESPTDDLVAWVLESETAEP